MKINDRIKELSRLAHGAGDSTYAEGPDGIWLRKYEKKFAELIVKEVFAEMGRQLFLHSELQANDPGYQKAMANTLKKLGVKE